MSTAFYIALCNQRPQPFVALPIFLSRSFRYGNLFVHRDSPFTQIEALRGKRVGLPEYGMTMGVWLRGIFSDVHGVQPGEIEWVTTRDPVLLDTPPSVRVAGIEVTRLPSGTMWEALEAGRLDAVIGVPPQAGLAASSFRRLYPTYWEDDLAYFRNTGNFPIMHSLVVRRHIVDEEPEVVQTIFRSFCLAKRRAMDELRNSLVTLSVTLPLLSAHVDFSNDEFGPNWWPYGFEENRSCLETLLRYCLEQGVIGGEMSPEELFHADSLDLTDDPEWVPEEA
jgi:4,5-dihydroxyphthalate decarboxylase